MSVTCPFKADVPLTWELSLDDRGLWPSSQPQQQIGNTTAADKAPFATSVWQWEGNHPPFRYHTGNVHSVEDGMRWVDAAVAVLFCFFNSFSQQCCHHNYINSKLALKACVGGPALVTVMVSWHTTNLMQGQFWLVNLNSPNHLPNFVSQKYVKSIQRKKNVARKQVVGVVTMVFKCHLHSVFLKRQLYLIIIWNQCSGLCLASVISGSCH